MFRVSWALLCCPRLATRVGVAVAELIEAVDDVGFDAELLQELKEAPEGCEDFHADLCPFPLEKKSLLK